MTKAQAAQRVAYLIGDTVTDAVDGVVWAAAEVLDYLDAGQDALLRALSNEEFVAAPSAYDPAGAGTNILVKESSGEQGTAAKFDFAYPVDCFRILEVSQSTSATNSMTGVIYCRRAPWSKLHALMAAGNEIGTATNPVWAPLGQYVRVFPVPAATKWVYIQYVRVPTLPSAMGATELDFPLVWHDAIALYAAHRCMQRVGLTEKADSFKKDFDQALATGSVREETRT